MENAGRLSWLTRSLSAGKRDRTFREVKVPKGQSIYLTISTLLAVGLLVAPAAVASEQMAAYEVVDENSIPKPLTDQAGDPVSGREIAINRKQGNCLACHKLPIPEQQFHGEVGPDLTTVADAYDEGELRLRVVNPKVVNPDTIMPAFYRTEGLHRVIKKFQGKTVLDAQQVEDVVAYLKTLKSQ